MIPLFDTPRLHRRQHAGFATQAKRRGEQYVSCGTCGARHERSSYAIAEAKPETVWDFLKALATMVMLVAAFVALTFAAAAYAGGA